MDISGGTPRNVENVMVLDGKRYHLMSDNRGAVSIAIAPITDQDIDPVPFSISVGSVARGSGFSFEGPEGTYDVADGWDLNDPGRAVTWPRLATGEAVTTTDARGWLAFHGGYLYVARGRYVAKYDIDDTEGSEWPVIEIHDLGDGKVAGGRPAAFNGKLYLPIRTGAFGTAGLFHELTTVATTTVEEQRLVMTGSPTGGTYTVTFDGKTTAAIAYNASGATLQAALRLVAGLERVTVSTSGSTPNFTHDVTMTGVGGALGASSPPQFTASSASLTGGSSPTMTPSTVAGGTTDTWTAGPAGQEAVAFANWQEKLVRANGNVVATVSDDPMTGGDWGVEYPVGDPGRHITDLGVYGKLLVAGKVDGLYSFDEETNVQAETPDLAGIVDNSNCLGMERLGAYMLVPHKSGLIRWRPGAWEFVGPEQEGGLDGSRSEGWGRVQGIAQAGRFAYYTVVNPLNTVGALMSFDQAGGRETQALTPHLLHQAASAYLEHVLVLSKATEPATPKAPGTLEDDSAVGTVAWTDPSNADDSDDSYATMASAATSHYLKGSNFAFSIPDEATITGVRVTLERSATS